MSLQKLQYCSLLIEVNVTYGDEPRAGISGH